MLLISSSSMAQWTFHFGTSTTPKGETLVVDSTSFIHNGRRVIPVMGEMHYARIPRSQWRDEILKMKAGGVTILSTYIFWIHHEEERDIYRWDGNRDLNAFLRLCRDLQMPVMLRIGPFCHGEVRNGGFPDWMYHTGAKMRSNDAIYLSEVTRWFRQMFSQIEGQLWKHGGSVIGIQLENEYPFEYSHLATLKRIAVQQGYDVPIYTRTGWPQPSTPSIYGEMLPLYGDYPASFWNRSLEEALDRHVASYVFRSFRGSTVIATEQLTGQTDENSRGELTYPFLTCELGGGMQASYHRRPYISPMDIYAMALVKVANGSNLPGYYMYHGGVNPDGKRTTMQENQRTYYVNNNDMPIRGYDFQAPLGEVGQPHGQFHLLRLLHAFLADYGDRMAAMPSMFPVTDKSQLAGGVRWAVRTNGHSGFIFVNNFTRRTNLPVHKELRLEGYGIPTARGAGFGQKRNAAVPFVIDVPANKAFIMPYNLCVSAGDTIRFSSYQPIYDSKDMMVMMKIDGVKDILELSLSSTRKPGWEKVQVYGDAGVIKRLKMDRLRAMKIGKKRLLVVSEEQARHLYRVSDGRLFVADGILMEDGDGIYNEQLVPGSKINVVQTAQAGADRQISIGVKKVAEEPDDSDFSAAAVWQIRLDSLQLKPENGRALLQITYKGDVARVYQDGYLLNDNFNNGQDFWVDLESVSAQKPLLLKILRQPKDAPVYTDMPEQVKAEPAATVKLVYMQKTKLTK